MLPCLSNERETTVKLATLKAGGRDGTLILVDARLNRAVRVPEIARTLQVALDSWDVSEPRLRERARALAAGDLTGEAFAFDAQQCASPLPRAYQWCDGSAYLSHMVRVRKARGAEMPESFRTDPLMYQGGSDSFLGPRDPIQLADESWGIDFEAEVTVVTDDVPMGITPEQARRHIKLVMLCNDVSLRNLMPAELGKGFGFFQSKPSSAFSPVAVTPDELGTAWDGGKLNLPVLVHLNGASFGRVHAGKDLAFDFPRLISHAALSRPLCAGTIIGSGTVSNEDTSLGASCIQEVRMLETIEHGSPRTQFMRFGDQVRIEAHDVAGSSIFGAIDQRLQRYAPPR